MKIYIAGPYTGNEEENTLRMIDIYNELIMMGHYPFCPLLSHYANKRFFENENNYIHYEKWLELDINCLMTYGFDALYFMGESPGANVELSIARALGLKIFYDIDGVFAESKNDELAIS